MNLNLLYTKSGAGASCGKMMVSVGSLEWVRRHGVTENPFVETGEFNNQSVVCMLIEKADGFAGVFPGE
ncbi:hypothetical protein L1987_19832 [Smallanthus sonchifolius]|uniref:Uncharacterized protein n=1 Tax=Smallanthus sonchifolius TaxID=185202 RepID=A0ACB9IRU0_9ASTR|nr:hypothetical protein L1987_19832 [Smallanthus sonchifolius]